MSALIRRISSRPMPAVGSSSIRSFGSSASVAAAKNDRMKSALFRDLARSGFQATRCMSEVPVGVPELSVGTPVSLLPPLVELKSKRLVPPLLMSRLLLNVSVPTVPWVAGTIKLVEAVVTERLRR